MQIAKPRPLPANEPLRYKPSPERVDRLISLARSHPLGLDFLQHGALDAVAATFETHAFVVDEARQRLRRG